MDVLKSGFVWMLPRCFPPISTQPQPVHQLKLLLTQVAAIDGMPTRGGMVTTHRMLQPSHPWEK